MSILNLILFVSLVANVFGYPTQNCGTDVCLNGGVCNSDGSCSCDTGTLGDKCQYKEAEVSCENNNIAYTFYFRLGFNGNVSVENDETGLCDVTKSLTSSDQLLVFSLQVDLTNRNNVNNCAHLVEEDIATYTMDFVIDGATSDQHKLVSLECILDLEGGSANQL